MLHNVKGIPSKALPGALAPSGSVAANAGTTVSSVVAGTKVLNAVQPLVGPEYLGDGSNPGYFVAAGGLAGDPTLGFVLYGTGGGFFSRSFRYTDAGLQWLATFQTFDIQSLLPQHLRLSDGSILSWRANQVGVLVRIVMSPSTYALTQSNFCTLPTSGSCVTGESFALENNENAGLSRGASVVNWTPSGFSIFEENGELIIFRTAVLNSSARWVVAFVYNLSGVLLRVHKIINISLYSGSGVSYSNISATVVQVRKAGAYFHIAVTEVYAQGTYPITVTYGYCSRDLQSDIDVVFTKTHNGGVNGLARYFLVFGVDDRSAFLAIQNLENTPYALNADIRHIFALNAMGKPIVASNNRMQPSVNWDSNSPLSEISQYAVFDVRTNSFIRGYSQGITSSSYNQEHRLGIHGVDFIGTLAVQSDATFASAGGWQYRTLGLNDGGAVIQFAPRVIVNSFDGDGAGSYASARGITRYVQDLSNGFWLGWEQRSTGSDYGVRLYKEAA